MKIVNINKLLNPNTSFRINNNNNFANSFGAAKPNYMDSTCTDSFEYSDNIEEIQPKPNLYYLEDTSTGYIDPSSYEDCFERMSFEHEPEPEDFWRENENYDFEKDSNEPYYQKYSDGDIQVSDHLLKRDIGLRTDFPVTYYPELNLDLEDRRKLKQLEFKESIIPATINNKVPLTAQDISSLGQLSANAWFDGIPTTSIVRTLEKSMLYNSQGKPYKAEPKLFDFLLDYPTKRPVVVVKTNNGEEVFDRTAATYYKIFNDRLFDNSEITEQILKDCKTADIIEEGLVDKNLCNIVSILRRKNAAIAQNSQYLYYSPLKIDKSTPWTEKESELLQKLKWKGDLNKYFYEVAVKNLRNENKSVDYVIEYLDKLSNKWSIIDKVTEEYNKQASIGDAEPLKRLRVLLRGEFFRVKDNIENDGIMVDLANELQDKGINLKETLQIIETVNLCRTSDITDLTHLKNIINWCTDENNVPREKILPIMKTLYDAILNNASCNEGEEKFIHSLYEEGSL